ncbi:DUF2515 domain-containing protein [Effusibacillus lacus]|uniref:DUF2515 domain-containing protein n=1 Tax=Effusibacillus lacus TaxID=1348429 RepID=A0A292YDR0_9BACL|nr:DUF2515 domain-containing protein [Effusibacillus lacus]TCS76492.1 uncharacterized protein DUF2515 [Effusibacillus lacus]GAX90482.1 hypothetical protein EFBL_2109 [Effusibacillus lacus]
MNILQRIFYNLKSTLESTLYESEVKARWKSLKLPVEVLESVKSDLSTQLKKKSAPAALLPDEKQTMARIQEITTKLNRNNETRTEAYRQIYFRFPELHWAFLAHMVSRNGGWQMTDLKGNLLPHLLEPNEIVHFFNSLERANALIFQDAYPQLLLYEESVRQKKNLFHLLPAFHVSKFMRPVWNEFWARKNSQLLTVALIINEQCYIQKRVAENPVYQKHVYETLEFKTQSLLQLTQVVFPFFPRKKHPGTSPVPRLAGLVMEDFTDLKERIGVGKSLYAILFGIEDVFEGALRFAKEVPHTGSRADYWPHIFSKIKHKDEHDSKERLVAGTLQKGAPPFFSPELQNAWEAQPVEPPERFDWFTDLSVFEYFRPIQTPDSFDMTDEFLRGLNTVELAVLAKEHIKP